MFIKLDLSTFRRRVMTLNEYDLFEREIDLEPDTLLGFFDSGRVGQLKEYIRSNPDYHIVSLLYPFADARINRCVDSALGYQLAEGEADPYIVYDPKNVIDDDFIQSMNSGDIKPFVYV